MAEIELNPIDFITLGTVGPKGRRQFNLQAGAGSQIVTLTLEKEQARRLGEAVGEMLDELQERFPEDSEGPVNISQMDMDLRDPIEPEFRIAQMGLGYDDRQKMVILVAQELVVPDEDTDTEALQPGVVRFWGTREQFRALSDHTLQIVDQGRADPRQNGHVINYWT
jgi:uncharacterized repeat protein (TIGR03847 family)